MTANQIEYWKLQETRRHNVATETMDRPVKESQAAYNYSSIDLIREQIATQDTIRAMNLASAAASYANATNQYAQAALNQEKINTEQIQQGYIGAQARNMNLRSDYQDIVNFYAPTVLGSEKDVAAFTGRKARDMDAAWNRDADQYATWSVFGSSTGLNAGDILNTSAKIFATIYN